MTVETRGHEFTEECERVFVLELTGPGNGEDSFREPLAVGRLIPEGDLSPLHGWADSALGDVVGRLNSLLLEERKEMVPVVQEPPGPGTHGAIGTVLVMPAGLSDATSDQGGRQPELLTGKADPLERVPAGKEPAKFMQEILGESVGIGAASGFLHALELADEMGQTQLPLAGGMIGPISGMVVAGKDAAKGLAEGAFEDLGGPARGHLEKDRQGGNKDPKPSPLSPAFPTGFIDIEHRFPAEAFLNLPSHRAAVLTHPVDSLTEGAKGDVDIEEGLHDFGDTPAGAPMDGTEIGDGSMESGSKLTHGNFRRKLCAGPVPAGTAQFMGAVFGLDGCHLRQFKNLMP